MGKTLYIVTIELEALVLADDEAEACRIAREQRAHEDSLQMCNNGAFDAQPATYIPNSYTDDESLVYHAGRNNITVREAAKIGGQESDLFDEPETTSRTMGRLLRPSRFASECDCSNIWRERMGRVALWSTTQSIRVREKRPVTN